MNFLEYIFASIPIFLGLLLLLLYKWITRNRYYFADRGIPYKIPNFLFGNMRQLALMKQSFLDNALEMYNYFPDAKIQGTFELTSAITMIRDPDLIKQIAIKDFDHFTNHRTIIDEEVDPLFGRALFNIKGEKWHDMRSTLSPAFTGSKMRSMFELVLQCSEQMKEHLLEQSKQKSLVIEMKDLFSRFANDVIATCAFGIQINSLKDPQNEFYAMGKEFTELGTWISIKFFGYANAPGLMKALKVDVFGEAVRSFFRRKVMGNMKYREENKVHRPDMIHLLMQATKGQLEHEKQESNTTREKTNEGFAMVEEEVVNSGNKKSRRVWEDDDLTGQCVVFFFAGFDAASTLLCFMGHELAINPEVQGKLIEEVDEFKGKLGGKSMNYETINKMAYLDMVVSETLRKWSPAVATDRVCNKPYSLNVDGRSYNFQVGDVITIPILGIHRDEKYYKNPELFDPERFSEENKAKINPNAYLPFGVGRRGCIASRFALMEAKAMVNSLLSAFTFEVSEKTQIPLQLKKGGFAIRGEKGYWVHLKPREI